MGYFISQTFGYYEGVQLDDADIEVTQRPSLAHVWQNNAWVFDIKLTVPKEIDIMQAELALHQDNLLDQVNAAVAAQPIEVQIKWRRTIVIKRDNPMVNAVLTGLGLSEDQIDQLFINAAAIV